LAVDRLELATDSLLKGKPLTNLELPALIQGLEQLANTSADEIEAGCGKLIKEVTGFLAIGNLASKATTGGTPHRGKHSANTNADLLFFRSLALQFESRSPLFKGRTTRILRLALETNKANFTQWVSSGGSTIFTNVFIRTAEEFDKLVNIERSSLTFYNYRQSMEEVQELMVYGEITREYGLALLSRQKSGSLNAADNKILPLVQRALANITHARHMKGEEHDNYKMRGIQFLAEAKKILWATPADYPEFAASPMYFERTDFKQFENGSEKSIFVAGG
jgi:hypothetical protein